MTLPSGWSTQSLGSLLAEVDKRAGSDGDHLEVLSLTKRAGLVPQSERFNKRVATADVSKYKVVRPGQIVYNPYVLWEGAIFASRRPEPGVVSPAYLVWERNEDDGGYLDYVLRSRRMISAYESRSAGAVNRRRSISKADFATIEVPVPPIDEQRKIAHALDRLRTAVEAQVEVVELTVALKRSVSERLFAQGLGQSANAGSELPAGWKRVSLDDCCAIRSSSMAYTVFAEAEEGDSEDSIRCMAIKVSDMTLPGNETSLLAANVQKNLPRALAEKALVPPGAVVFPKRGAAIATNKKRLTTTWTALDPNLIALCPTDDLLAEYLHLWMQTFDLRTITVPGPTPQLNKKDLVPVQLPLPPIEEQRRIVEALKAIDEKLIVHVRTHETLLQLQDALLEAFAVGETRISDEAEGAALAAG